MSLSRTRRLHLTAARAFRSMVLMLPGAFLVPFMSGRVLTISSYVASGAMTILMVSLALALNKRRRLFKFVLAPAFAAFCILAFFTLLMLRA